MTQSITITINSRSIPAHPDQTILDVAEEHGIHIPTLCYHPDLPAGSSCRMCVVEISGQKELKPACSTHVQDGMVITTENEHITKTRQTNLELLFGQHERKCYDCVRQVNCPLISIVKETKANLNRFPVRSSTRPISKAGPIIFDQTKCIDCRACVEVCPVGYLQIEGRGADLHIIPTDDPNIDCIYCGQCLVHCPAGAIESTGEFEETENPLKEKAKGKMVVVQFAPSIRTSIGEMFDLEPGTVVTGQLTAALRQLGFDHVFDTSVGADFTTYEEAKELLDRVTKNERLPAFSSCCPAWVKFVEFYYPEFIPNLCTTRSPQILLGSLIKTHWAKQNELDPRQIVVVSIMPCTSKKFEIIRPENDVEGIPPVDYVLTTRELGYLLKRHQIHLSDLEPEEADNPFGHPSGAGVIYGASGGVFESAFRTAHFLATGRDLTDIDLTEMRGQDRVKYQEITLKQKKLKTVVVNGIKNAREKLEELKQNPHAFAAMEVMACPGGCIGGGGQPIPTSAEIRQLRAGALYRIDRHKSLRLAHDNPSLQKVYADFLTDKEIIHKVAHTSYSQKKKEKKIHNP